MALFCAIKKDLIVHKPRICAVNNILRNATNCLYPAAKACLFVNKVDFVPGVEKTNRKKIELCTKQISFCTAILFRFGMDVCEIFSWKSCQRPGFRCVLKSLLRRTLVSAKFLNSAELCCAAKIIALVLYALELLNASNQFALSI